MKLFSWMFPMQKHPATASAKCVLNPQGACRVQVVQREIELPLGSSVAFPLNQLGFRSH